METVQNSEFTNIVSAVVHMGKMKEEGDVQVIGVRSDTVVVIDTHMGEIDRVRYFSEIDLEDWQSDILYEIASTMLVTQSKR